MFKYPKKKYEIVRGAISTELADFIFNYFLMQRESTTYLMRSGIIEDQGSGYLFGSWKDSQIPNTFSKYGDIASEILQMKLLPVVRKITGLVLLPTYSYTRLYKKGDILHRHKDRFSCEISTTIHLGGKKWPIFLDATGANNIISGRETTTIVNSNAPLGTKVDLEIGDMLIYSGSSIEHWREAFEGKVCGQVFLHYNDEKGPHGTRHLFDGRVQMGIPKFRYTQGIK